MLLFDENLLGGQQTGDDCGWNITAAGMVVSLHVFFHKLSDVALLSAFGQMTAQST